MFTDFKGGSFQSIQLQSAHDSNEINALAHAEYRAIIALRKENFLIVYSQRSRTWQKLWLSSTVHVIPQSLIIRNDETVLVTDAFNTLWTGNLSSVKFYGQHRHRQSAIPLRQLGKLLGMSKSLSVTSNGHNDPNAHYLYYYIPRDGAIVRWDFR